MIPTSQLQYILTGLNLITFILRLRCAKCKQTWVRVGMMMAGAHDVKCLGLCVPGGHGGRDWSWFWVCKWRWKFAVRNHLTSLADVELNRPGNEKNYNGNRTRQWKSHWLTEKKVVWCCLHIQSTLNLHIFIYLFLHHIAFKCCKTTLKTFFFSFSFHGLSSALTGWYH